MIRATQSLLFAVIYSIYLVVVMLPVQRFVLRPLCALNPVRRPAILRWWFRLQADWVLGMARTLGGLRIESQGGPLPGIPLIVVMNHQSLFDIPAAVSLLRGPYPVIPTRALYTRWIPGISGIANLGGFPSLKQGARATRAEHAALVAAAEAVARGERTMILYPEGHRSRDGELLPFMTQGLKLVFRHAHQRPVYVVVVDGAWRMRSFADIAFRLAGQKVQVRVLGPYAVPPERGDHEAFIASLRSEMTGTLARLRGREVSGAPDVSAIPDAPASPGQRSASVAPHASRVG
ncbi:MAG: lysophospholipid acyltransferase family protein [Candidatus Eiseniibacteriota bacterium]